MESRIAQFLDEGRVSQADIAARLNLDASAVSRKVAGKRPWKLREIESLASFLSQRLGRQISYDELLGAAASTLVGPEAA